MRQMIVHGLKRSGESLSVGARPGQAWTQEGRDQTVRHLAGLSDYLIEQNTRRRVNGGSILGAIVVIGAGNGGFRGTEMVKGGMDPTVADQIGLLGTVMNTMVVHSDLEREGVPHRTLLAEGVGLSLPVMKPFDVCTPDAIAEAIQGDMISVIGAGSAALGQSTDAAIMDHLKAFRDAFGADVADVAAYKATRYGGVYDDDPANNDSAQMLSSVTTQEMRANGWAAVDPTSLDLIDRTGVPMRMHRMDVSPAEAIGGANIGTIILPHVVSAPVVSVSN